MLWYESIIIPPNNITDHFPDVRKVILNIISCIPACF